MKTNSQWYNNPIWVAVVGAIMVCILPISILAATIILYFNIRAILEIEQLISGLNELIFNENLLPPIITAMSTVFIGIVAVILTNKYADARKEEERNRKRLEANALAIDILAEWVHPTFNPDASSKEYNEYIYKMQIAYWKSILWIDKDLLLMLNKLLIGGDENSSEIVAQTRKYVQELKEPDIPKTEIVSWPTPADRKAMEIDNG